MSVSPRLAEDARPHEVVISPRVLDQNAFEALAATLRCLVDDAGAIRDRLEETVLKSSQSDDRANRASVLLQERLRLSARVLKAFQAQIGTVETLVRDAEDRVSAAEDLLAAAEQRFEERIGRTVDAAISRLAECGAAAEREITEAHERASFVTMLRGLADQIEDQPTDATPVTTPRDAATPAPAT